MEFRIAILLATPIIPSYISFPYRIDNSFVIKVADFGLSESIETSKDYFRQDGGDAIKLPIKWLALESINDGIFSEKTDVVIKTILPIATSLTTIPIMTF